MLASDGVPPLSGTGVGVGVGGRITTGVVDATVTSCAELAAPKPSEVTARTEMCSRAPSGWPVSERWTLPSLPAAGACVPPQVAPASVLTCQPCRGLPLGLPGVTTTSTSPGVSEVAWTAVGAAGCGLPGVAEVTVTGTTGLLAGLWPSAVTARTAMYSVIPGGCSVSTMLSRPSPASVVGSSSHMPLPPPRATW